VSEPLAETSGPAPIRSGWHPAERESFFDAIARHRAAAWKVHAVSLVAGFLIALIVSLLLSPLFYAVLALLCDLANLLVPTVNLVEVLGQYTGPLFDAPELVPSSQWLVLGFWAALPGMLFMTWVMSVMRRSVGLSGLLEGATFATVPPTALNLEEQRFMNVTGEMALAAGIPAPRVLIADWNSHNAAVFGADDGRAVIVVARVVIESLNRAQLQAVIGHLIGSIANGDMTIGVRVSTTTGLFNVIARLGTALTQRASCMRLLRAFAAACLRPTPDRARVLVDEVADPFRQEPEQSAAVTVQGAGADWRTYAWLPLAGPIFATGFFGGILGVFLLEPLVSLAWRRRKYLADATAVRLTRDPEALSTGLQHLGGGDGHSPLGAWGAHLCVVRPATRGGRLLGGNVVPAFPSLERRLRALVALGASSAPARVALPLGKLAIVVPLLSLAAVLMVVVLGLLVYVSAALSALFLGLPFGLLHLLLRALGHG
jgi:Zn-dependent protease with chaperone function